MNFFDAVIIGTLVGCLVWGFYRGVFKELFSVAGMYLGLYFAFHFYPGLADIFSTWISDNFALKPLSFVIILTDVFAGVVIMGTVILYLLKVRSSGLIQRFAGALLGGFKGIIIVSLLFILFAVFLPEKTALIKKSWFSPHLAAISEVITPILSKKIDTNFKEKLEEFRKEWKS